MEFFFRCNGYSSTNRQYNDVLYLGKGLKAPSMMFRVSLLYPIARLQNLIQMPFDVTTIITSFRHPYPIGTYHRDTRALSHQMPSHLKCMTVMAE
jgi:hypothetical protein